MNQDKCVGYLLSSKAFKKKLVQDFMKRKGELLQKIAMHDVKKEGIKKEKEVYKKRVEELKSLKERSFVKGGLTWNHYEEDKGKINEKVKESFCEKGYIAAMVENMKKEKEMLLNLKIIDDDMIINFENGKRKRKRKSDGSTDDDSLNPRKRKRRKTSNNEKREIGIYINQIIQQIAHSVMNLIKGERDNFDIIVQQVIDGGLIDQFFMHLNNFEVDKLRIASENVIWYIVAGLSWNMVYYIN